MLPVPLNSWKITSSMRLPVSTSTEAMMVSEPAILGLAGGGEELAGLLEGADVKAAGAGAAGVLGGVVGAGEAGDRVDEEHDIAAGLDEALGALDAEIGHADVILDLVVVGRGPDLRGGTLRLKSVTSSGRSSTRRIMT